MPTMPTFRALRIHETTAADGKRGVRASLEQLALTDLGPGEVVVRVAWSSLNYKDALAATGAGRILRRYPLVGGVDLSGVVESSEDPQYRPGDRVLVTGCGLSETLDGGYAERVRVPAAAVIRLPAKFDLRDAMVLGTAGFTAALALHRLEQEGLRPGQGPVVVTGASGGVGSLAVDLLAGRGHEVWAITGKPDAAAYLAALGATQVLPREGLQDGGKPLESVRWAAAIDNVGGETLARLLRGCAPAGSVAAVGLVGGADLHTTVMPFLLRGVNLLGINSSAVARDLREQVWQRLATDMAPRHLARIGQREVTLDDLLPACHDLLAGTQRGRVLVRIGGEL
jgi:acrylyl-CoA reductase (NADPH)